MTASKVIDNFELKTKRLPDGDRELLGPLKVERLLSELPRLNVASGDVCNGRITINSGFISDFSSIPTPLHWVVGWSQVDVAGVVHDFLYRDTACPRAVADDVWLELARSGAVGVGRCRARLCWTILRGFGRYNRASQPEPHLRWLVFSIGVLGVVSVLMVPILTVSGLLWLVDRVWKMGPPS